MAIVSIHKITWSTDASANMDAPLNYCQGDKSEFKFKDDIADAINYAINDKTGEIIFHTVNSSQNCIGDEKQFFKEHINKWRGKRYNGTPKTKDGNEVIGWHLVQSFDTIIDPNLSNEIGRKLAQEIFTDFPVTISTHTNTEHTHNHLIINAWDLNGRKWNNCNENYRRIRMASDRLCDEYGLKVLEETRKQHLIRYKDKDGITRYFEPTARKVELIKKREQGDISTDDVNSYRNTNAYENLVENNLTNREIIKNDIDSLLLVCDSYEHLLNLLKDIGYEIKDKKKNGDWLSHVAFKNPTAQRFTRDNSIGENGFYERINLSNYIDGLVSNRERGLQTDIPHREDIASRKDIPYFEQYLIGETDITRINEDFRKVAEPDGTYYIVPRGEVEKDTVRQLKIENQELYGLYDTSYIDTVIRQQKEMMRYKKSFVPKRKEEMLVAQIQEGFENLKFIESRDIHSYKEINQIVAGLWRQYDKCENTINELNKKIDKLEMLAYLPKRCEEIQNRIVQNIQNEDYLKYEYDLDRELLISYQERLKKHKIDDVDSVFELEEKISSTKEKINKLQIALQNCGQELKQFDRCIRVLERANKNSKEKNLEKIREFEKYREIKREAQKAINEKQKTKEKEKKKEERDKER